MNVSSIMKKSLGALLAVLLIVAAATLVHGLWRGSSPHTVTLNWQAPASIKGSAPPRYNIYRSDDRGKSFTCIAKDVSGTTYDDTTVKGGKTYRYTVTSVDEKGLESVRASGVEVAVPK